MVCLGAGDPKGVLPFNHPKTHLKLTQCSLRPFSLPTVHRDLTTDPSAHPGLEATAGTGSELNRTRCCVRAL